MIRLSLGNVGSGKTVCEVRNLFLNPSRRKTYSNIQTKKIPHNIPLKPENIIKKVITGEQKHRDGSVTEKFKYELDKDFWCSIDEPINVVIDEAHTMLNPRRSMSKINIIMTDWLALIRRVLGSNDAGEGEAVFITQLPRRLDPITRDMATEVRHHICHYKKMCEKCHLTFVENSDSPDQIWVCPRCHDGKIIKFDHIIEVLCFANMNDYYFWYDTHRRVYFKRYFIKNISDFFPLYNTLQWDDMFSKFY